MTHFTSKLLLFLFLINALGSVGCERADHEAATREKLKELDLTPEDAKRILQELSTKRAEHEPQPVANQPRQNPIVAPAASTPTSETGLASTLAGWLVDELVDVAPAAASLATDKGIVVINGGNELFLAKVGPLSQAKQPVPSPIALIPDRKGPFALGRGPSVAGDHAYWITSHFLLRRPVVPPYGPLDIVAEDARIGTRASAVTRKDGKAAVAYVALPKVKDGPLRAKLWLEGDPPTAPLELTESGTSALSVDLVKHGEQILALSLEARMGVTALHARAVVPEQRKLHEDQVLWVGGTAAPLTEVRTLGLGTSLLTFLAMEQDTSHFGLAVLSWGTRLGTEPATHWTTFANGLDPAPVAAVHACNSDLLLFARPTTSQPKSPQELVLAKLAAGRVSETVVLSNARAFYDLSLAALRTGALVSFVADQRTWARTLRCI
jgi:hypothetical protein